MTPTCPQCGESAFRTVYEDRRLTVVRCPSCGLVQQSDYSGALARLDNAYADPAAYYSQRGLTSRRQPTFNRDRLVRTSDILREMCRRLQAGSRILDVGCGSGEFLSALGHAGFDVLGVEPDPVFASFAAGQTGTRVIAAPYSEEQIAVETLDALTLIQVLEHLEDPLAILRTAHGHLKVGGLLVIDVPSFNNPRILAYRATGIKRLVRRDFIPAHCYYYTRTTLCRLVEKAGFHVDQAVTGRYAVKTGKAGILYRAIDRAANRLGIGGIVLYAVKRVSHSGSL